jgi:hypothetical protein
MILVVVALTACASPVRRDEVLHVYRYEGFAYHTTIELFADGHYLQVVYQIAGNSISTRENKWRLVKNGEQQSVVFNHLLMVETYKGFAKHRVNIALAPHIEMDVSRGFFGTLILTQEGSVPLVRFVSVD